MTKAKLGTSFVTTAPAAIKEYLPTVTPQIIVAFAPTEAPVFTSVVLNSVFLLH